MSSSDSWDDIIDEWQESAPWNNQEHVIQDLVLSRIIVEFANDRRLRRRLVLHGGTCLHKIWHDMPQRYSEDLEFLCVKPWHLLTAMRRMRRIVRDAGVSNVHFRFWGYPAVVGSEIGGRNIDLKIDFNPTRQAARRAFRNRSSRGSMAVESKWYRGQTAQVPCASATDILASKIAAIMTRTKARDLADLCTGIDSGIASVEDVVSAYQANYRRKQHPRTLRPRVESLMSQESFLNDLSDDNDFMPTAFAHSSLSAVLDSIDRRMTQTHNTKATTALPESGSLALERAQAKAASRSAQVEPQCGQNVQRTGRPCFLRRGHRGRCRSVRRKT